jgi:hypothetical protein
MVPNLRSNHRMKMREELFSVDKVVHSPNIEVMLSKHVREDEFAYHIHMRKIPNNKKREHIKDKPFSLKSATAKNTLGFKVGVFPFLFLFGKKLTLVSLHLIKISVHLKKQFSPHLSLHTNNFCRRDSRSFWSSGREVPKK